MIKVSVMYPSRSDARFDHDYYRVRFGSKENDMTIRLSIGGWLVAAALLGLLAVALWAGYEQWIWVVVSVPPWGWVLMALGGGLSVLVGVGLMGLIFYSSRMGYDEPPQIIELDKQEHP